MKKILTILLALAIVFSLFAVTASAETENFAKGLKWAGASTNITEKDGVLIAKGIKNKWYSPYLDVLPAVKKALGDGEDMTIEISFETLATFTEGNEGNSFTSRVIMRGTNALSLVPKDDPEAWNEAYQESIDGEDPLFVSDSDGNIVYPIGRTEFNDEEWTPFSVIIELNAAQVNTSALSKWDLCVDEISVEDFSSLKDIQFRNVKIVIYEEPDPTPTPEPTPTPTPTPKPQDVPADSGTAENTDKSEATPTPDSALPTPDLNGNELGMVTIRVQDTPEGPVVTGLSLTVCILALAGTFVVGAGIGFVIGLVIGKKKNKKAE